MKTPSSKRAFDEAYNFAKDPRPFNEKVAEYEQQQEQKRREIELRRNRKLAEQPVDMAGMVKSILFINQ